MDGTECLIALLDRINDNPERHDVGELLERDVLALHLDPDRIGGLLTAVDRGVGKVGGLQRRGQFFRHPLDHAAALRAQEREPRQNTVARFAVEFGKREVFEFVLHAMHADALGERRVDLHRLARDLAAFVGALDEFERPHIVQAIGQLDQEDPNILRHRQHELAKILGLLGPVGLQFQPRQLGDAIDKESDLLAKQARHVFKRRHGIFHGIVE